LEIAQVWVRLFVLLNLLMFIIKIIKVPTPEFPKKGERAAKTCREKLEKRAKAEAEDSKM
jgi:hypothetical protein